MPTPSKKTKSLKAIKAAALHREMKLQQQKKFIRSLVQWGILFVLTAGLGVAFFFIGTRVQDPSLADFLPQKKTLAYVELSAAPLPSRLKDQTWLKENTWALLVLPRLTRWNDLLKRSDLFGRGGGVAFLAGGESLPVILLPFIQEKKTELDSLWNARKIDPKEPLYTAFTGPYFVISPQTEPLEALRQVQLQPDSALSSEPLYTKTASHLPRASLIRGYVTSASFPNLTNSPLMANLDDALVRIVDHVGFSVRTDDQGLLFNTYMALQPDFFRSSAEAPPTNKVAYRLTELVSANGLVAYAGGANLSAEWQHTLQTLHTFNPAYAIIFEGILRTQIKNFFGEGVDLRNDLYPLLQGEYALSLHNNALGRPQFSLILTHDDALFAKAKMEKLQTAFRSAAAQFVPKIEVYDLPDGTQSKVLVADPGRIKDSDESYEGYTIHCTEIAESPYGFCTTVTGDKILASNSLLGIKEALNLTIQPHFVLSHYQPFRKSLSRLAQVSDEVTFINVDSLATILQATKKESTPLWSTVLAPFFNSVQSVTWAKHTFRDGVSAEGYVLMR